MDTEYKNGGRVAIAASSEFPFGGAVFSGDGDGASPTELAYRFGQWLHMHRAHLEGFREHGSRTLEDRITAEAVFQKALWTAGWTKLGWPTECGGFGGGALHRGAIYEQIWASGYVQPEGMQSVEVIAPALVKFAPNSAREYLASYLSGDEVWCQAFSEPGAGSDLASLRTRAAAGAAGYRLSGRKIWSSLGSVSRRCMVLARTGARQAGHRDLSMFFVDLSTPGITVAPIRAMTGQNEFCEILFDDVPVPSDALMGIEGQGWAIAMYVLQWERGMYAWQRQAFLHRRLEDLVAGRLSGSQLSGASASIIGRAYAAVFGLRMASRETLTRLAKGENPGPEISIDKLWLAEAEQLVFDAIRDCLGGSWMLTYDDVASIRDEYLYSRAASVYGGSAEIQHNIVSEMVMGLPREPRHGR